MKKRIVPVLAALALIVVLAGIAVIGRLVEKYIPTDERLDASEYFGITEEGQVPLIMQDEIAEEKGIMQDGLLYLDYRAVKDYLNDKFYWDSTESLMLYTMPTELIRIPANETGITVGEESQNTENATVITAGDNVYILADYVQSCTNMEYQVYEEPTRAVIQYKWGTRQVSQMRRSESVRREGGVKSLILTDLEKGDTVTVLDQMETWSQVVTEDGYIGYVRNRTLGDVTEEEQVREFTEPEYTRIQKDYTINLVWHQVTSAESNAALETDIQDMTGVNTISPTWFSVIGNDGSISSLADSTYVETAHQRGLEVWGLVDNFNTEVDITAVLSATTSRQNLISQLIDQALQYDLDGINVDFETLPEEAGEAYIEFIRELSIECRNNSLVLSTDNTVPRDFSAHYDRAAQGEVVDYFIIMGYDEHYVGSEPGSVASLGFEREGIELTIEEGVPADKIISGVPFYTRLWMTSESGEVTSEAIGMNQADETLEANGVTSNWSEETSQDYAEYYDSEGNFYQIWLENENSLAEKAKLVPGYQLAGIAAWKLGFERSSIWEILSSNIS